MKENFASTVLAIPVMDHTDRKKKISISTKASTTLATKLFVNLHELFAFYFLHRS
jgi:hypothetical protein